MIELVKPAKPNQIKINTYLAQILETGYYTNNGPLVQELESHLAKILDVNHVLFTSNGTVSLELALKSINAKGNIITTPYSYVATANAAHWLGLDVRFADLLDNSFFPCPSKIESLIDQNTSALLITQVYGLVGPLEDYVSLAAKYNIPLILDAAHAFGVTYKGKSVSSYGDLASFSFHATKVFHTVEGGAIVTNRPELRERLFNLRSFGHRGDQYLTEGINAKNSEVHAAFGLAQLDQIQESLTNRKRIFDLYVSSLTFNGYVPLKIPVELDWNYCYFPLLFDDSAKKEALKEYLLEEGIMSRRYFYPALNTLGQFKPSHCPVAEDLASKVLCIPHYAALKADEQSYIIDTINKFTEK